MCLTSYSRLEDEDFHHDLPIVQVDFKDGVVFYTQCLSDRLGENDTPFIPHFHPFSEHLNPDVYIERPYLCLSQIPSHVGENEEESSYQRLNIRSGEGAILDEG